MPFSGGVYSRVFTWATEALSPPIAISKLDTQEEDIASALSSCLLRDGTGLPTATIDWNAQRLTNLGAATAATDAVRASQIQGGALLTLGSVAGTNTITGNLTPALAAYVAHMMVKFTPVNNNTGAATLALNALAALDIQKADGDALVSGDLVADVPAVLVLDAGADDWILLNPQASLNGIATSDFARLSQSNTFTSEARFSRVGASIWIIQSDAAANNGKWLIDQDAEEFNIYAVNDAENAFASLFRATRTAQTVDLINLQATAVQVNGSTVRGAALERIARARVASDGTLQSGSTGITSVTRNSVGNYTINLTAAGFTEVPTCVACGTNIVFAALSTSGGGPTSTSVTVHTIDSGGSNVDVPFTIICLGV